MIDATIQYEDGSQSDAMISLQKQFSLFATDDVSRWLTVTLKNDLMMSFRTDTVFEIDLDDEAIRNEWNDYVLAALETIGEARPGVIEQFVQTGFMEGADTRTLDQAAQNLGSTLGAIVEEEAGLTVGEGPTDPQSMRLYGRLAHAMLACTPSINQRYESSCAHQKMEQLQAKEDTAPSFHSI